MCRINEQIVVRHFCIYAGSEENRMFAYRLRFIFAHIFEGYTKDTSLFYNMFIKTNDRGGRNGVSHFACGG